MGKEIFTNIPSKVKNLVDDVRIGKIGLPDLQRPFVWKDNKVRDLFDSMLRGYPIGYVMLWESPTGYDEKKSSIGGNKKIYEEPKELVIDGQQRLTALVAAMYVVKVKDKNYGEHEIKISYNPLTREFAELHRGLLRRDIFPFRRSVPGNRRCNTHRDSPRHESDMLLLCVPNQRNNLNCNRRLLALPTTLFR